MRETYEYLIKAGIEPNVAYLYAARAKELLPMTEAQMWKMAVNLHQNAKYPTGVLIYKTPLDAYESLKRAREAIKRMESGESTKHYRYKPEEGEFYDKYTGEKVPPRSKKPN